MSHRYQAVGWNRQKKIYDLVLAAGVVLYVGLFVGVGAVARPQATIETLLIRAFGTCALLMLHVVLSIGPLCRLDRRLLPLLYNRRHLGVATFLVGAVHAVFSIVQFHALGDIFPLVSVLVANPRYDSLAQFPFEVLGLLALGVLFLMAATSHDFWLANLTAPVWKALHMLVYVAYGALVLHVALGVLQAETSPVLAGALGIGLVWVLGLHLVTGFRERADDAERSDAATPADPFVEVCGVDEIPEQRARIACLGGERVAVFRYEGKLSAVSNVCRHQNGPLGEGKIVDGCITCPWHGFQYLPETGASPPPFTEKVPTFRVELRDGRVFVDPRPNPPGTRIEPARIDAAVAPAAPREEFYVGYLPGAPPAIASRVRFVVAFLLLAAAVVAGVLVYAQRPFAPSVFEFGVVREFRGILHEQPYPILEVERPGDPSSDPGASRYYLVAFGKHGAAELVAGLGGEPVRLRGSLIYRDGATMVEVESGSVERLTGEDGDRVRAISAAEAISVGRRTLVGEIVDSKCFLGVMKPGHLKPHRSCAARCISGGVPPVLVVRDTSGVATYFLLVDAAGGVVNRQVLPLVAEPVEITGDVVRYGDLFVLRADPSTYRRL